MSRRRTSPEPRSRAADATEKVDVAAVEERIASVEARLESLRHLVDAQSKQIASLRAQIDHYEARLHWTARWPQGS